MSRITTDQYTPEEQAVADTYIETQSIEETARILGVTPQLVANFMDRPHIQGYLTAIMLDRGYRNPQRIFSVMDRIIESKLKEAEESDQYSSKDLLEILALAHKMRMDELKHRAPQIVGPAVNVQVNNQTNNYSELVRNLLSDHSDANSS